MQQERKANYEDDIEEFEFSQSTGILNPLIRFLKLQIIKEWEEKKQQECASYIKELSEGYCSGITSVFFLAFRLTKAGKEGHNLKWFMKTIQFMEKATDEQLLDDNPDVRDLFNLIEHFQNIRKRFKAGHGELQFSVPIVSSLPFHKRAAIAGDFTEKDLLAEIPVLSENKEKSSSLQVIDALTQEDLDTLVTSADHDTGIETTPHHYLYFDPNTGLKKIPKNKKQLLVNLLPSPVGFRLFGAEHTNVILNPSVIESILKNSAVIKNNGLKNFSFGEDKAYISHLHIAAWGGDLQSFKFWFSEYEKAGILNVHIHKKAGHLDDNPLILAVHQDHLPIVQFLIDQKIFSEEQLLEAFSTALNHDKYNITAYLLPFVVNHKSLEELQNLLDFAADRGCEELVNSLLKNASPLDLFYPLYFALKNGYLKIASSLLAHANQETLNKICKTTVGEKSFVYLAASWGFLDITKQLLNIQPTLLSVATLEGETPFHAACKNGNINLVRLFIEEYKIDIEQRNNLGQTPLQVAALFGKKEVVEFLIKNNANIHTTDNQGDTLLHTAAKHPELMSTIVKEYKLDPTIPNKKLQSPLHYAALKGAHQTISYLLEQKTAINAVDQEGQTPLYIALAQGNTRACEVLIAAGADPTIKPNPYATSLLYLKLVNNKNLLLLWLNKIYKNEPINIWLHKNQIKSLLNIIKKEKIDLNTISNLKINNSTLSELILLNEEMQTQTPFHTAVRNHAVMQDWQIFVDLEKKADINALDEYGKTPLELAIEKNDMKLANFLVSKGAKFGSMYNYDYYTQLLEQAFDERCYALVGSIIKLYPNIQFSNSYLQSDRIVQFPAKFISADFEIANWMLNAGVDLNIRTPSKLTTLDCVVVRFSMIPHQNISAEEKQKEIEKAYIILDKMLERTNIDINSRDHLNKTTLHRASERGLKDVVKKLLIHGADYSAKDDNQQDPGMLAKTADIRELILKFDKSISIDDVTFLNDRWVTLKENCSQKLNQDIALILSDSKLPLATQFYQFATRLKKELLHEIENTSEHKSTLFSQSRSPAYPAIYTLLMEIEKKLPQEFSLNLPETLKRFATLDFKFDLGQSH